jgi:large subunit ribosomal protein L15
MKLNQIQKPKNLKKRKRSGRGLSSGSGGTSGRGTKGQKSRTNSGNIPKGFEGGQTPLKLRLPKIGGFKHFGKKYFQIINLFQLNNTFSENDIVSPKTLMNAKLIKSEKYPVKILGTGNLEKKLKFEDVIFSHSVSKKITPQKVETQQSKVEKSKVSKKISKTK